MIITSDNFIYVTQKQVEPDMRYILAHIKQQTYSITLRLNYNITPDISIQYYGSPFISTGIYDNYKKTLDAGADDINDRYHDIH